LNSTFTRKENETLVFMFKIIWLHPCLVVAEVLCSARTSSIMHTFAKQCSFSLLPIRIGVSLPPVEIPTQKTEGKAAKNAT